MQKIEKDSHSLRWPGLWPEIANGQKIFPMARWGQIWPDLKNLAIRWPGWQHCCEFVSFCEIRIPDSGFLFLESGPGGTTKDSRSNQTVICRANRRLETGVRREITKSVEKSN